MNQNDRICGFVLKSKVPLNDINGKLHTFIHEKSGATLYYLEREDECKTFGIGFKTIPRDDTGVFHIIEHSVLCGSEKYPVKDPFTEVMKGSVNVFMNAFTASDKTYYPISTRNEQDFYNLISVYLDAVFHPLMLKNKSIFLREGVRIELDEDGRPVYSGVVYNEMTGAYSRVEEEADLLLSRMVFPNGSYSFDTGGHPDAIPELTYEALCETYREFYHPSNSCVFLDGSLDIDKTLSLIDGYLSEYEKCDLHHEITLGGAPVTEFQTARYAIEEGQKSEDAGYLFLSSRLLWCDSVEKTCALNSLIDTLADNNTAPLKKRVLDLGLCDNFDISLNADIKYCTVDVEFFGVKDGQAQRLIEEYRKICKSIIDGGIDRRLLAATLNSAEFRTREADFGSNPKGMLYLSCCLDAWCCDIPPENNLSYEKIFLHLRDNLAGDYYERTAEKLLLPDEYCTLLMLPDEKLHGEVSRKRAVDCESRLSLLGEEATLAETEEFYKWQEEEDSPEALAAIPRLSVSDLKDAPKETPTVFSTREGAEILFHPLHTSDIIYSELYFDLSDLEEREIYALRLLATVLSDLPTAKGSAADFAMRKKESLGSLYAAVEPAKKNGEPKLFFSVKGSALKSKGKELAELISEYLYQRTDFDLDAVKKKLSQLNEASESQLASHGTTYAITRTAARYDRSEALKEHCFGFSFRCFLDEAEGNFDKVSEELVASFKKILGLLTKNRLTLGVTCDECEDFIERLLSHIPRGGGEIGECAVALLPRVNEGIVAATHSGYSVRGANLSLAEKKHHGALTVLGNLLGLNILLEEIRLKGGAYDTGFIARANSGTLAAYSYRDPSPERSVEVFVGIGEKIRRFLDTDPDLSSYVVSTVGSLDPISTPRSEGSAATFLHLCGLSHADTVRLREEALGATSEKLNELSQDIDTAFLSSTVTVVASKEKLLAMGSALDDILEL